MRWAFQLGFGFGALLVVPGVFVALLVPAAETVWPYLTPGTVVLRPLSNHMAAWPGAVNVFLLAVVNGLFVGALASGIARMTRRSQRRD
jgi:hypothetical protein